MKKKTKKRIRIRTILLLILSLSTNTFAWFVYNTKVENNLTTSVRAWHVSFEDSDSDSIQYMEFEIDHIYPGMEDYENYITVTNDGETNAEISYEIKDLRILDKTYIVENYTQEELNKIIDENYPFKIKFSVSSEVLEIHQAATFNVKVTWPYESDNDDLDTLYGSKSYEYMQNNPDSPGISIKIKLSVSQVNE